MSHYSRIGRPARSGMSTWATAVSPAASSLSRRQPGCGLASRLPLKGPSERPACFPSGCQPKRQPPTVPPAQEVPSCGAVNCSGRCLGNGDPPAQISATCGGFSYSVAKQTAHGTRGCSNASHAGRLHSSEELARDTVRRSSAAGDVRGVANCNGGKDSRNASRGYEGDRFEPLSEH